MLKSSCKYRTLVNDMHMEALQGRGPQPLGLGPLSGLL